MFDRVDVATRLGRYLIQELTGWKGRVGALFGTLLTAAVPALILFSAQEGSWTKFWTLFGASNQLLAALTLLLVTVWLTKLKKPILFTLLPMLFVMTITLWALIKLAISSGSLINSATSFILVALAFYLLIKSIATIWKTKKNN